MRREWKSFRITLILYSIVFILPSVFYFVYHSFDTMRMDTKTVRQSSWLGGAIESVVLTPNITINSIEVVKIDDTLRQVLTWVMDNDDSNYYIGTKTLSEDFYKVNNCWNSTKRLLQGNDFDTLRQESIKCWDTTNNFSIIIEKMVYLKQNKIINTFYISLILMMLFTIILIYSVRAYIDSQMKKHAIYDLETNLFNQKYFLSQLDIFCTRAKRNEQPLTILSIFIALDDNENKLVRQHVFEMFGGLLISLTRTSDVACRYDTNMFSVFLPETTRENALILENRVREMLAGHDFMTSNRVTFKFSTVTFDYNETNKEFVGRAHDQLG